MSPKETTEMDDGKTQRAGVAIDGAQSTGSDSLISKWLGGYSPCGGCSPESTSDYAACDGCQFNPDKPNVTGEPEGA